ncbi:MAG TPA: GNAT family N-acetyltransferase [Cryomorphaceae bacterium]|nr:GNAT family N-acetyltransferase [Cryomorphaceae bacterium]
MNVREIKPFRESETIPLEAMMPASPNWASIAGDGYHIFEVSLDGKVSAYFAVHIFKKLGKTFVINPPFMPHCGLTWVSPPTVLRKQTTFLHNLLEAIALFFKREYPSSYIDISFPRWVFSILPFEWNDFLVSVKHVSHLNLDPAEESLLAAMSPNLRRNILKDESEYRVEYNTDPDEVLTLLGETMRRAGEDFKEDQLAKILNTQNGNWVFWACIKKDNLLLATSLFVCDSKTAYYLSGGINRDVNDLAAGSKAVWAGISRAKTMKLETFDFCGSSVPSIENYFRKYGVEQVMLPRIRKSTGTVEFLMKLKSTFFK